MSSPMKPFAVVTGASSGIGLELAKQFAEHDHDLLLCADDDIPTDSIQASSIQTVRADLRTRVGVDTLYRAVSDSGRDIDALVLNAGVGQGGAFVDQYLEDILSIVDLNVASTVHLARLVLPDMVRRGSGRVL